MKKEDYELEVGSAGIGQPFKVLQQYVAHVGCEVEVLDKTGKKWTGVLADANEENFYGYGRSENKTGRCQASEAGGTECNLYL